MSRKTKSGGLDKEQAAKLKQIIDRLKEIDEARRACVIDANEVYRDAKTAGFNPRILRKAYQIINKDQIELTLEDTLLTTYRQALGI